MFNESLKVGFIPCRKCVYVVCLESHVSAGVVEVVRLEAVTLVVLGLLLTHCWSRPRHSGLTWLLSHRVMVSSWEMRGRSCQWYNNLILNLKSIFSCNFRKLAQSWNVCLCAISLKKKDLTKDQSENMYKINPGWFFSYFWSFWMNRFRFFLVLCICIFPTQNVEAGIKDVGNTVWHFQKFPDSISIGLSSSTEDHFIFQCSISSGKLASKFV